MKIHELNSAFNDPICKCSLYIGHITYSSSTAVYTTIIMSVYEHLTSDQSLYGKVKELV